MMVNQDAIAAIKQHVLSEYPKEACGVLLASGGYVACQNMASNPHEQFMIDPRQWRRLTKSQDSVVAVVHSHPDRSASPSEDDMRAQISTNLPWGIVAVSGGVASDPLWFGDGLPIQPLEGRSFVHGVTDCYSLIRDWYRLNRQITLAEIPRNDDWWSHGQSLYEDHFGAVGFYPIDAAQLQEGDVVLARVLSKVTNHGGIYLGNGLILHHLFNRLSRVEPLARWQQLITHCLRHGDH